MNPLRDKRQFECRKLVKNSTNLDIGCGNYPINQQSLTMDVRPETNPKILGSVLNIPLENEYVENVSMFEMMEHLHKHEQRRALQEVKRILKPHGHLVMSIPNSSAFMKIPQQLVWEIREHTTQREYHNNKYTHTHIGLISPKELTNMMTQEGFKIILAKRLMLYTFVVVAEKIE